MSTSSKKHDPKKTSTEKTFDEYFRQRMMSAKNSLERINIVCEKLKRKYEHYEETKEFIDYLKSVESVFINAENGSWSIEKTQDELIKAEIYLMSQSTGIDEDIFKSIYDEFVATNKDIAKIQEIADKLIEKYSNIEDCFECEDCKKFIIYVKDALLVFAKSLSGDEQFDELVEVKEEVIKMQMQRMAEDDRPPLQILQEIYIDFITQLKK